MTTPITQEDRDFAALVNQDGVTVQAIDFAVYRQAAVAKREAEIVELIQDAERNRFASCLLEDHATVGVYFTASEILQHIQAPPQGE